MTIQVLPPDVAGKIAAGEVVERPASVVKELIENALDAGATEIRVEIKQGGQRLIRVADNGSGIEADEVELAFQHHATSKLRTADDLFAIHTLGFRGEALPSIAAVSQVTVLTRTRSARAGTQLRLEGGAAHGRGPQAAPAGTIISVENLFFNVPARRKFLKTVATETGLISEIASQYALAYPDRRFTLVVDGRTTFGSPGSGKLYDALIAVYGLEVTRLMLELPATRDQETGVAVQGYIGGPALHRANRKYMSLFVNGRYVRNSLLITALDQAYQSVVPTGRHPVVVLLVEVPPDQVDVNVHPQKQEVKFARGDEVFRVVQRSVRRTLVEQAPVHRFSRPAEPLAVPEVPGDDEGWAGPASSATPPHERFSRPRNVPEEWEPPTPHWAAGRLDRTQPARDWSPGPAAAPATGRGPARFGPSPGARGGLRQRGRRGEQASTPARARPDPPDLSHL
ncbi:MAG: DNA mismatch repair endonuclease MutL [Ardenticatenaceae bacterium]|nr:DNA mismatch repair endonuclease MutL [Ardenticatenaceae bacterium]